MSREKFPLFFSSCAVTSAETATTVTYAKLTSLQSRSINSSSSSSSGLRARRVLTFHSLSVLAVAAVVVGTGLHRPVAVAVRGGDRRWRVSVLRLRRMGLEQ